MLLLASGHSYWCELLVLGRELLDEVGLDSSLCQATSLVC